MARIFISTLMLAPLELRLVAKVLRPLWLLAPSMPAMRYIFKKGVVSHEQAIQPTLTSLI